MDARARPQTPHTAVGETMACSCDHCTIPSQQRSLVRRVRRTGWQVRSGLKGGTVPWWMQRAPGRRGRLQPCQKAFFLGRSIVLGIFSWPAHRCKRLCRKSARPRLVFPPMGLRATGSRPVSTCGSMTRLYFPPLFTVLNKARSLFQNSCKRATTPALPPSFFWGGKLNSCLRARAGHDVLLGRVQPPPRQTSAAITKTAAQQRAPRN